MVFQRCRLWKQRHAMHKHVSSLCPYAFWHVTSGSLLASWARRDFQHRRGDRPSRLSTWHRRRPQASLLLAARPPPHARSIRRANALSARNGWSRSACASRAPSNRRGCRAAATPSRFRFSRAPLSRRRSAASCPPWASSATWPATGSRTRTSSPTTLFGLWWRRTGSSVGRNCARNQSRTTHQRENTSLAPRATRFQPYAFTRGLDNIHRGFNNIHNANS